METFMKKALAIACGSIALSSAAFAQPPLPNVFDGGNLWAITYYNDPTSNHQQWATQHICFMPYSAVGTSIQGTWYSTTFPDWNGRYYQEGDEVKMTGDYAGDVGHDHMTVFHTTYDVPGQIKAMAFKDWTEWREDGRYGRIIGWGNTKLERIGKCRYPFIIDDFTQITPDLLQKLEAEALAFSQELPERLTVKGEIAAFPGQEDLESISDYQARTGLR